MFVPHCESEPQESPLGFSVHAPFVQSPEQQSELEPQDSEVARHEVQAPPEQIPEQQLESAVQLPPAARHETHWLVVALHAFEQQFLFSLHSWPAG
jgi:hypothetical protein